MIKLVFCLRRKPGMTPAEFRNYWLNQHAPLVRTHTAVLRIRRYVQTHTLDDPAAQGVLAASRGAPQHYDGVAELWFESREDMALGVATPEGRAAATALLEDERRFIDHANSPVWIAEEHEIIGG